MVLKKHELEAKLKDEHQLISSGVLREENPLDVSKEFAAFLEACRRGDLKQVQEQITAGININGKDKFDYTPLIVASLCGHEDLARLLLESGALAERNTFQGERCIYNALTDRIRNLLLSYDFSKSSDPLQLWSSHITSLLTRSRPKTSDISLASDAESFQLHKIMLSARTPYFRRKLMDAPETTTWRLSHSVPVEAFDVVLRYLYLGDLPTDLVGSRSSVSEEDVFKGIGKVTKLLEVETLWEVLSVNDRRLARQRYEDEVKRAQDQVDAFFQEQVLGHKMRVETRKVDEVKWKHDNSIFADCLLRADEEGDMDEQEVGEMPTLNGIPIGPAAVTTPTDTARKPKRSVVYPVHKAFLIRSPYFETMFSSDFKEAQESSHLHMVKVDCTPEVLEVILTYLYTEKMDCPLDLALELLYTADMLLIDRLKSKAAMTISTLGSGTNNVLVDRTHGGEQVQVEVEPINVYDVIRAAWDLNVQRLEAFAARYLAGRLEDYVDDDEFAALIKESAGRVKNRQETDTIELLDDIRYYLDERFRLRFEDAGLEDVLDEDGASNAAEPSQDGEVVRSGETAREQDLDLGEVQVVRTLDGGLVEDEFESDAQNFRILLDKIEGLLVRLKLDA